MAPQSRLSLLAAVPLPVLEVQAAERPVVVAVAAVQPTAAELAVAALPAERYQKCWESFRLGQSLDQCCEAAQLLPDSSP